MCAVGWLHFLTLEEWPSVGMSYVSQQYTPLLSPKGQGPAGHRVGSDLCLRTLFCTLLYHSFLASVVCLLVGEADLEACAGFLVGETGTYPLVGRVGSWPSGGQGCVKGHVQRWLWVQEVFSQPVC